MPYHYSVTRQDNQNSLQETGNKTQRKSRRDRELYTYRKYTPTHIYIHKYMCADVYSLMDTNERNYAHHQCVRLKKYKENSVPASISRKSLFRSLYFSLNCSKGRSCFPSNKSPIQTMPNLTQFSPGKCFFVVLFFHLPRGFHYAIMMIYWQNWDLCPQSYVRYAMSPLRK